MLGKSFTPVLTRYQFSYRRKRVGSYLLLDTIFHCLYSVVLPIVICAKSIVIFVRSIVLLPNPEPRSMRHDTTQENRLNFESRLKQCCLTLAANLDWRVNEQ